MRDNDLIRRGDAIAAAANLYKWSIAAGEELEAAIRAIPATDARAEALKEAVAIAEEEGWLKQPPMIVFMEREEGSRDCAERIASAIRDLIGGAE